MPHTRLTILTAMCALFVLAAGAARAVEPKPPFTVQSEAAVLINARSGSILCAKNPDMTIPPASLTKLMTLVVAFDDIDNGYISLDDQVPISAKAWRTGGSKMFIEVGTTVPLRLLLEGIAIVSGNDACVAVAEHIAGTEEVFVEKMNRKAAEIGMRNTEFKNSHGLPDGQHTTARDMAILARYYVTRHPESLQMHGTQEMTYHNITQQNRNGLLARDSSFDGLKTGWFKEAGYHIIATAYRDQDRFIAVVLGAQSVRLRETVAQQLINYGFKNYTTIDILNPRTPIAQAAVWKGVKKQINLGAAHALTLTLARHDLDSIVIQNDYAESAHAPIVQGQEFGRISILIDEQLLATVPLVALEDVEQAGVLKLALHTLFLLFVRPPYWGALILALMLIAALSLKAAARRKKKKPSFLSGRHGDPLQ
jgi:serine-type D-Ala-D-Ala carboxypeptidase (penicillin-binding protein 5/6)